MIAAFFTLLTYLLIAVGGISLLALGIVQVMPEGEDPYE